MKKQERILENIVAFCRRLRHSGVSVTTGQVLRAVDALREVSLSRREDVRSSLRAILISRKEDLNTFNQVFDSFWRSSPQNPPFDPGQILQSTSRIHRIVAVDQGGGADDKSRSEEGENEEPYEHQLYSSTERLRQRDFARLTSDELRIVKTLMRQFHWDPPLRKSRRRVPSRRGVEMDLRRMMRSSLKSEGWPLSLMWRARKRRYRPLVLICDISGSMEPYARILLQFAYVLSRGWQHIEVFVFSTRLTRISHQLRHKDADVALSRALDVAADWGGGTRIGEALREFNYRWSRRVLSGSPTVLMISDGWDRGDAGRLSREMERLRRSCHTLIWLNPLLGTPGYRPLTRGIQEALPLVDYFLPVHNLSSLEQLAELLHKLPGGGRRHAGPGAPFSPSLEGIQP